MRHDAEAATDIAVRAQSQRCRDNRTVWSSDVYAVRQMQKEKDHTEHE